MTRLAATIATLSTLPFLARAYTWPDYIYDALEELLVPSSGLGSGGFYTGVSPCSFAPANQAQTGRQAAAEWVRTYVSFFVRTSLGLIHGAIVQCISRHGDRRC